MSELTVYFCCDGTVFSMRMGKVLTHETKPLIQFCRVLYATVHSICKKAVFEADPMKISVKFCSSQDYTILGTSTLKCADRIHKLYDLQDKGISPNLQLIQSLGDYALPGAGLHYLSKDEGFAVLNYQYLSGPHRGETSVQAKVVLSPP